jgi:hypothetical protein
MPRQQGLKPIGDSVKKIIERIKKEREERRKKGKPIRTQPKLPGMGRGGILGVKNPLYVTKTIRTIKPTLGRKKTEEFLKKLKNKKKKMGGGMLKYKKGGFPDLSGDGKTTMKDILIGRGVIKKKSGGSIKKKSRKNPMKDERAREGLKSLYRKMGMGKMIDSGEIDFSEYKKGGSIDKNVRVIDLQKQGKTSKKGIRVKGKGKSFMDVYKKTVYNRAEGGMVPFGGEKRVPGSGAATRGTGFKGIF